MRIIIYFFLIGLFIACESETEKKINNFLSTSKVDFNNLKKEVNNVNYSTSDNLQFGIINLNDSQKVKFWFLTHHLTSDIGGTVYEFPDGQRESYDGFHCCEVQFYDSTKITDLNTFKGFLKDKEGINP